MSHHIKNVFRLDDVPVVPVSLRTMKGETTLLNPNSTEKKTIPKTAKYRISFQDLSPSVAKLPSRPLVQLWSFDPFGKGQDRFVSLANHHWSILDPTPEFQHDSFIVSKVEFYKASTRLGFVLTLSIDSVILYRSPVFTVVARKASTPRRSSVTPSETATDRNQRRIQRRIQRRHHRQSVSCHPYSAATSHSSSSSSSASESFDLSEFPQLIYVYHDQTITPYITLPNSSLSSVYNMIPTVKSDNELISSSSLDSTDPTFFFQSGDNDPTQINTDGLMDQSITDVNHQNQNHHHSECMSPLPVPDIPLSF